MHYVSNEFVDMQRGLDCRHKEGGVRPEGGVFHGLLGEPNLENYNMARTIMLSYIHYAL